MGGASTARSWGVDWRSTTSTGAGGAERYSPADGRPPGPGRRCDWACTVWSRSRGPPCGRPTRCHGMSRVLMARRWVRLPQAAPAKPQLKGYLCAGGPCVRRRGGRRGGRTVHTSSVPRRFGSASVSVASFLDAPFEPDGDVVEVVGQETRVDVGGHRGSGVAQHSLDRLHVLDPLGLARKARRDCDLEVVPRLRRRAFMARRTRERPSPRQLASPQPMLARLLRVRSCALHV